MLLIDPWKNVATAVANDTNNARMSQIIDVIRCQPLQSLCGPVHPWHHKRFSVLSVFICGSLKFVSDVPDHPIVLGSHDDLSISLDSSP
jgi:hypothetical protein